MSHWSVEYLKHVEREAGRRLSAIAREAGLYSTTLTRPVNNPVHKYRVKQATLDKVEEATGIPWAPFSRGETVDTFRVVEAGKSVAAGQSLINVYDVQAEAGNGAVVDEYETVASRLAFPPDYLRHITTTSPKHLAIISVKGGSMLPKLNPDDVVMVDGTKTNISYDGMFVIRHDGLLKVKRLRWGDGKRTIRLISDNASEYPEEEHGRDEIEVVGRVIWVGAKQP